MVLMFVLIVLVLVPMAQLALKRLSFITYLVWDFSCCLINIFDCVDDISPLSSSPVHAAFQLSVSVRDDVDD
jgi:hypothetical protein